MCFDGIHIQFLLWKSCRPNNEVSLIYNVYLVVADDTIHKELSFSLETPVGDTNWYFQLFLNIIWPCLFYVSLGKKRFNVVVYEG